MRYLTYLGLAACLLLTQCAENQPEPAPDCSGSCLFVVQSAPGTMTKLECFNRFAIQSVHPETNQVIYGIPDALDAAFEVEGKAVVFSASFRANTLMPTFPDPSLSAESLFQVEVSDIR